MNMRSRFGRGLVVALVAGLLGVSAQAGMKTIQQVVVNEAQSSAWGDLGYARNTADSTQYIGCYLIGSGVDGGTYGICTARNAAGVTRSCSTDASNYLYIITSINSDSFVQFKWNTAGKCTMIIVETHSTHAPKQP
jgi:hypothetical protein